MRRAVLLPLLAAGVLAGCSPPEPVKLGFIGGLSGRVADLGESARNGFQLAVEQANAAGGINGRRIEILVKDDGQDREKAKRAAEELVAAGVKAIVGPVTSAMAEPILAVATAANTPVVSPTVTTSALTGKDDLFLRVTADTSGYSSLSARFHYEKNGLRRIAVVFDARNRAYTEDWLSGFRRVFTGLGGTLSAEIAFDSSESPDHARLVRSLLATKPDGLLFIASAVDTARFAQAARDAAGKLPLIGVEWSSTERLIELGGKAVDGMHVAQFFDRHAQTPEYLAVRNAYEARFKSSPGFASIAGYDATRAILEALSRHPERPLKQALIEGGPFPGAQQPIRFDRFGDAERRAFVTEIRDGKFVAVE